MNSMFLLINNLLTNEAKFSIRLNNQEDIVVSNYGRWMIMDKVDYMTLKYKHPLRGGGYGVTEHNIPYMSITGVIRGYCEDE